MRKLQPPFGYLIKITLSPTSTKENVHYEEKRDEWEEYSDAKDALRLRMKEITTEGITDEHEHYISVYTKHSILRVEGQVLGHYDLTPDPVNIQEVISRNEQTEDY